METWSTRVRARGTLVVHWCAETTPNDCRVGDAARCLSSNPHHGAPSPTTVLDSSRGKNGWKSCTVYDRPIIGLVPVERMFLILFTLRGYLADDGGFFNGAEQSMEARIDDYLEIYFFFFIIAFFICRVSCYEIFVLVQRPVFFVILINCSLVILSSFELEVFRSNF